MAERTAILIDSNGDPLGVDGNPLYISGIVAVASLVELTDVAITDPASGDYIGYDASTGKYINKQVTGTGLGDVVGPAGATAGNLPILDSSGKILHDSGLAVSEVASIDYVTEYVEQYIHGVVWQDPVISVASAAPVSPTDGDRYIVSDTPEGDWIGHENCIATWWEGGPTWLYLSPGEGWACYNRATDTLMIYNTTEQRWVDTGSSGVPEAPSDGEIYGRLNGTWSIAQSKLFYESGVGQISPVPVPIPGLTDIVQVCSYEIGPHPGTHTWPEVTVFFSEGATVILRGADGAFDIDDAIELHTAVGTLTIESPGQTVSPRDVSAYFNVGTNTVYVKTYSTVPDSYGCPDLFLYVTPGQSRDIVPRTDTVGNIGTATKSWGEVVGQTIIALGEFKVGDEQLSYSHVGAAPSSHVHSIATQVASGFMPALNGDPASYMRGDGTWGAGGAPAAHATSHLSTGDDPILPASPDGYSGLMTGADKTKLDGIATGAEVNVNADWNSGSGDSQILNKPTLGTVASWDVGTGANNILQLNASAQIPAVDGTLITGVSASNLSISSRSAVATKKGQAVYIIPGNSALPDVALCDNTIASKSRIFGIVVADGSIGDTISVRRGGVLTNVDTRTSNTAVNPNGETWVEGDLLFATTNGGLTKVRPTSGRSVKVGYSIKGSNVTDSILLHPMENPVWVACASGEDVVLRLGDNGGANKVSIRDYANNEVASINSDGVITGVGSGLTGVNVTASTWIQESGSFTATPASTSTLTMTSDKTGTIKVGMGLKYVIGGVTYYGMVSAIVSNLLTVRGAPLGGDVTALYYCDSTRLVQMPLLIPGYYEDANNTALISSDLGQYLIWRQSTSYLVAIDARSRVADASSDGKINARVNGSDVCSTSGGLTLNSTNWVSTAVNIDTTTYDILYGEAIELNATKGTGGDAQDLSMWLVFVVA